MPEIDRETAPTVRLDDLPLAYEQIAHELRTPLAAIRSAGEILRDHPDLPAAERARFAHAVVEEQARLHALVEAILSAGVRMRLFN